MKKSWEETKRCCEGFSRMPPLTEATLTNPSFRTILGIVNSGILYRQSLWKLFTEKELTYTAYDNLETEAKFLDCLIQFLDKYSGESKLNLTGNELLGKKRNPYKIHKLLQRFLKVVKVGKVTTKEIKEFLKTKEEFLPKEPDKKIYLSETNRSKETLMKAERPSKGFATAPSNAWGIKTSTKEEGAESKSKSPYKVLKEVQELKTKKRELITKQSENKKIIGKLEKDKKQLEEQLARKKSELEELRNQAEIEQERQDVAREYTQLVEELSKKRDDVEKLRDKLNQSEFELESKLQPLKDEIDKLKKKNDEFRELMNLNESAILESSRAPDDIEEKQSEINRLQQENKELETQIEELKSIKSSESRVLLAEIRSSAADMRKLADEKEKLEESLSKLREESALLNDSPNLSK